MSQLPPAVQALTGINLTDTIKNMANQGTV